MVLWILRGCCQHSEQGTPDLDHFSGSGRVVMVRGPGQWGGILKITRRPLGSEGQSELPDRGSRGQPVHAGWLLDAGTGLASLGPAGGS